MYELSFINILKKCTCKILLIFIFQILNKLFKVLSSYEKSAIPPGNKPADPRSDPKFHNYQWINWGDYV